MLCIPSSNVKMTCIIIFSLMKKRKIRLYLGCSLSHGPKEFIKDMTALKNKLKKKVEVFEFAGLLPPDIGMVYQHDANMVRRCDIVVANITYPSLGLGMEMGIAIENRKPLITIVDNNCKTMRFLISGYIDPYHFSIRYKTISQAAQFIFEKLEYLFPELL